MTNLLKWGKFTSHSGLELDFKIDCDALTDEDLECCANIIADRYWFTEVYGVPKGGTRLAEALQRHCKGNKSRLLIVDDVLTTGKSLMEAYHKFKEKYESINMAVIFDRGEIDTMFPCSITSIFML